MPVQPQLPTDVLRRKKSLAKEEHTLRLFLLLNTKGPRGKAKKNKIKQKTQKTKHGEMWLIFKAMGSKTELYELFVFHSETCLCRGAVLNAAFQTPVVAYVGFF